MPNETTQRPTPGVVGVLNYLIDDWNTRSPRAPKSPHGDSVLQCLNILYERTQFSDWKESEEGEAAEDEAWAAAVEQLGLDPNGEPPTIEQQNLAQDLANKLLLQRAPKFNLFSTTEEAVEYWMRQALHLV